MEAPPSNSVKRVCRPSQFPGDADTASVTTLKNIVLCADHLSVLGGKETRLWEGLLSVTEHSNGPRACCSHRGGGRNTRALETGCLGLNPGGHLLIVTLDKFPNLLWIPLFLFIKMEPLFRVVFRIKWIYEF